MAATSIGRIQRHLSVRWLLLSARVEKGMPAGNIARREQA